MTFNLLISCMHQKDTSIIQRSNVQTDVVVVNQCDKDSVEEFDFVNNKGRVCHAKFINTTERGLSKSRNMAIHHAWGDICQICDDDEWMADDGEEKILRAYEENPDAALILFALKREDVQKLYPVEKKSVGFVQILRSSSLQITFSHNLLRRNGISFDEKMGSGTGNGGGEENLFMLTFRRKGLKLLYYPDVIATVKPGESQWFHGFDRKYFEAFGWSTHRMLGGFVSILYLVYWAFSHQSLYKDSSMSLWQVLKYSFIGYGQKR